MIRKLKNILCALPFGMKAADELMTTSNTDVDEGTSMHQQVEKKSVLQDLVNGEMTQQVEELRYETFRAEELSNEYQYIGSGQAFKRKGDDGTITNKRKKFVQYNLHQEYSMKESMALIENPNGAFKDDWKKRNIFKATYSNPCVRFKIENYAEKVRVDLSGDSYRTYFYFVDDKMNRGIRPLVNFIKKTKCEIDRIAESGDDNKLKAYKRKNELYSELESFSFTTINATNDVPNGVDYNFKGATLESIEETDGYVVLLYTWKSFDGNVLLSERFKSKTAEEKFTNKEMRDGYIPVAQVDGGSEVTVRDRDDDNLNAWLEEEEISLEN